VSWPYCASFIFGPPVVVPFIAAFLCGQIHRACQHEMDMYQLILRIVGSTELILIRIKIQCAYSHTLAGAICLMALAARCSAIRGHEHKLVGSFGVLLRGPSKIPETPCTSKS